ncbi:MAG: dihydrofolate reductase [Bacteroidota bacterium]|nr:dihydrofolate reductase [Bacteroidota bacterium]
MKKHYMLTAIAITTAALANIVLQQPGKPASNKRTAKQTSSAKALKPTQPTGPTAFEYEAEKFGDIQVLRYQIKDFDKLSLKQKELVYYLYEAALCGRDIIYDQKYKHNLKIRKTLETIWNTYKGDRGGPEWGLFETYTKRVWFSNGIHHHYASDKIIPTFSREYFKKLLANSEISKMPLLPGMNIDMHFNMLTPMMFDPKMDSKTVNLADGVDNVKTSCNNFYENVSEEEVENYYKNRNTSENKIPNLYGLNPEQMQKLAETYPALKPQTLTPTVENEVVSPATISAVNIDAPVEVSPSLAVVPETPISYGLNSKLKKEGKTLKETSWKVGGMYSKAIERIVFWLDKASKVAENEQQKKTIIKLIEFYNTGSLIVWDEYNIEWVKDVESTIDVVNGFIEVYQDAMGKRGSFESVVSIKDFEATKKIETIARNAQWFEDQSPIQQEYKKLEVKGIIGKSINIVVESGDAAPYTPIGINLPNANWIRQMHGSKSVSLGNIVESYNVVSSKSPVMAEFAADNTILERAKKYGALAGELHTDMHEVIGHASGQIKAGVGTPDVTLKNYQNALEEARADLVALYYIVDPKLVEIGVMPSIDCGKAEYDNYMMNGLMLQLNRIEPGKELEEAHMRNRQLIAKWSYERGVPEKTTEMITRDGKTYIVINDYDKLRTIFGELLREIQRIKSEGDYEAGKNLVENYGVKVDRDLHKEVLARYSKLNVAPYKGFIQPKLSPVYVNGKITEIKVSYPKTFAEQMLEYGKNYSFLPLDN